LSLVKIDINHRYVDKTKIEEYKCIICTKVFLRMKKKGVSAPRMVAVRQVGSKTCCPLHSRQYLKQLDRNKTKQCSVMVAQ
jgi:hypothetical protein